MGMSSAESEWSLLVFLLHLRARGSRRSGPLASPLFKILTSLCLVVTMTFIVWSWMELGKKWPQTKSVELITFVCGTTDRVKCSSSVGINDTYMSKTNEVLTPNRANELFVGRKIFVRNYCQTMTPHRLNTTVQSMSLSRLKLTSEFRRRFKGSRRNWIFIKRDVSPGNTGQEMRSQWTLEWCPIYKAASTPWMAIFGKLLNILTPHTEGLIHNGKLTFIKLFKDFRLNVPYSSKLTNGTKYRMLIVRHPFSRLLSAYRDKLERIKGREFYYRKYGYRILTEIRYAEKFNQLRQTEGRDSADTFHAMMSKLLEIRNGIGILGPTRNESLFKLFKQKIFPSTAPERPTFPEFVKYLLKADARSMDEHWRPMYLDCDPCLYKFDLLLKVETMDQDRPEVFNLLGILPNETILEDIWKRWTNKGVTKGHGHIESTKKKSHQGSNNSILSPLEISYFSHVPKSDLAQLYNKYELDFKLFDYSPQPYFIL